MRPSPLNCDSMEYNVFSAATLCIKEEVLDQVSSLISSPFPPSSTAGHTFPSVSPTRHKRGSVSCLTERSHLRPYPLLERNVISQKHSVDIMFTHPTSGRRHQRERGTPTPEDEAYRMSPQYLNNSYVSSSSSSLMGAMGDMSLHPRQSHSSRGGHGYSSNTSGSELDSWNAPPGMQGVPVAAMSTAYPGAAGHGGLGMTYPGVAGSANAELPLSGYPSAVGQTAPAVGYDAHQVPYSVSPSSSSSSDDDVRRLRRRIHELERELNKSKSTIDDLRNTMTGPSAQTASFRSSLHARTEARKRVYCSLNRAGNALCAWHDSRRERRAYPPRNAPPGHLNCGCTHEEALFEESLARHGVGNYLPGDTVRMDPVLRNPLLKLLQQRYGYKDGDFEHNPVTLTWAEGESPAAWEKKAQGGAVVKRRADGDRQ